MCLYKSYRSNLVHSNIWNTLQKTTKSNPKRPSKICENLSNKSPEAKWRECRRIHW